MPTPSELAARHRQDEALRRDMATVLALALDPRTQASPVALADVRSRLLQDLDIKALRAIHRRYLRLAPQDKASFEQLRTAGAHRSVLLQFIAATQDHELADRPTRDRVVQEFHARAARTAARRPFEVAARVAVPPLFATTCALVLPWLASKALLAAGVGLEISRPLAQSLEPLARPLVDLAMEETGGWLARAGLIVGAWVGWRHAARVLPDLKQAMAEPETRALDAAIGPGQRTWVLHSQLRKIPAADRHLLSHLLPAELRAFLRGDDEERRDILTRQPPPLLAQVRAVLATHPPGLANLPRALRDLGDLCMPEAWRRGALVNPRLDLDHRLARWRPVRAAPSSPPDPAPAPRTGPKLA